MTIELIAAVGRSGQLGLNGTMPWSQPSDLRWFREITMGHAVIFGRNTMDHLPVLPGRVIYVDDPTRTPEECLDGLRERHRTIFIGGGAKTYARYMHLVERAHVSLIDYDGPADVFMPPLWSHQP